MPFSYIGIEDGNHTKEHRSGIRIRVHGTGSTTAGYPAKCVCLLSRDGKASKEQIHSESMQDANGRWLSDKKLGNVEEWSI